MSKKSGTGSSAQDLLKALIIPDTHAPYHDRRAVATVMEVKEGWKPDIIALLGDWCDQYKVAGYVKDPKRVIPFKKEIKVADSLLGELTAGKFERKIFMKGNHETRLARYIAAHAPELDGITPDIGKLFHLQERGFEVYEYGDFAKIGKMHLMHDVGHEGVYAARQSVQSFGGCILFGHTHRGGSHYESTVSGQRHVGMTLGWLGDVKFIDYKHRARAIKENQLGFGILYVERKTGLGWAEFKPILGGKVVVDGRLYKG